MFWFKIQKGGWWRESSGLRRPALLWVSFTSLVFLAFLKNVGMVGMLSSLAHPEGWERKHLLWTSKDSHMQKVWNKYSHGSCHFAIEEIESEKVNYLPKVGVLTHVENALLAYWELVQSKSLLDKRVAVHLLWISNRCWTFRLFHSLTSPKPPLLAQGNHGMLGDFEESGGKPA